MSYGLIYTIPFASIKNEACIVEIEKEGFANEVIELTGSASPFTVTIDSTDFLYTPSRLSTANIRIVGNDYLQSLFSTAYQQFRVTFKRDGGIVWCGFIKPELYTQDYSSDKFELEIECISALSTLEYICYKDDGSRSFVSLWDLLKKCITASVGRYENVYIPHVYARTPDDYSTGDNVLEVMKVSEQDFFDEEDEAMSLKEVLEEICKLLNWTVCDWGGSLYFVDADHTGEYYKYSPDLKTKIGGITPNELVIQNIGFAGGDHSLDILPGYNKAIVKTSNYPVGTLIPDLFDTSLLNPLIKDSPYYKKIDGDRFSYFVKFYTNTKFNNIFSDKDSLNQIKLDLNTLGIDSDSAIINNIGSLISKQSKYKWDDGTPSVLNFEDVLIIGMGLNNKNYGDLTELTQFLNKDIPILQINPNYLVDTFISPSEEAIGYLLLSGQYFQSDSLYTNPGQESEGTWNNTKGDNCCKFEIKIGNKYWDGYNWVEKKSRFIIKCGGYSKSKIWYDWNNFENNVTYDMNLTSEGYAIPIKAKDKLFGKIEFTVLRPFPNGYGEGGRIKRYPYYTFMRNLKLQLFTRTPDGSEKKDSNSDRYYENVVNEDYVNELDEIEFKISSYNNDGACYSKVLLGDNYLTNNLYSSIVDKNIRPEEFLIQRIVNRYGSTKIKLTQVIREDKSLTPISVLYDNFLVGKKFLNIGGEIDYCYCQFKCTMIENV